MSNEGTTSLPVSATMHEDGQRADDIEQEGSCLSTHRQPRTPSGT